MPCSIHYLIGAWGKTTHLEASSWLSCSSVQQCYTCFKTWLERQLPGFSYSLFNELLNGINNQKSSQFMAFHKDKHQFFFFFPPDHWAQWCSVMLGGTMTGGKWDGFRSLWVQFISLLKMTSACPEGAQVYFLLSMPWYPLLEAFVSLDHLLARHCSSCPCCDDSVKAPFLCQGTTTWPRMQV